MYPNGFRPKGSSELSEYQKKVEGIDNVILCVAEVEKMVRDIGADLLKELPTDLLASRTLKRGRQAGTMARKPYGSYAGRCPFPSVGK